MPPAAPEFREPRVTCGDLPCRSPYEGRYPIVSPLGRAESVPASSVPWGKSLSPAEPLFLVPCEKDTGEAVSLPLQEPVEALPQESLHECKEPLAQSI